MPNQNDKKANYIFKEVLSNRYELLYLNTELISLLKLRKTSIKINEVFLNCFKTMKSD
ncbi:hypothetical protein QE380_002316 [Acinetobacter baylyi]|uniref:Uncharacterized protein n=1 Tax=Acinetobacter baylyi TaxID=202950 RepID=A0ABU0UYR3_ACIBI|nr:hypothetical protein [Acinetobacter baylyi]MDR6107013.1 hypothetical protein [Acinetobacter baylyi]MDR6186265.1 hypothetical protein [Acinetobacter baylyi]